MTTGCEDDLVIEHLSLVSCYRKMLDPGLATCSKQAMFLNLVYKSLKADIVLRRVKAFVKRLLQVTCTQMPPFICGALYLVSEILKAKPDLRSQLDDHPVWFLLLLDPGGGAGVGGAFLYFTDGNVISLECVRV